MKKITFFAIITLIISFLGSCKKDPLDDLAEDEARLQGLILEKGSKKPIEGATLYLYNCECSIVFGGGCHCTLIDSFKTGKDGRYAFTYKYKGQFDGNSFELRAKATNQYYKKSGFETIGPTDHLIIDYNVEFIPKAWVKVHIKNTKPFDEFDKIWIGGGWGGAFGDDQYYGKETNLFIKKQIQGNDSIGITWSVLKNNLNSFTIKKVYAPAHDTTNFEILY